MSCAHKQAKSTRHGVPTLPEELWLEILVLLEVKQVFQSACCCKLFRDVSPLAAKISTERRWPQDIHRLARFKKLTWKTRINYLEAHAKETSCVPDLPRANALQKVVNFKHRGIATEWLVEVGLCVSRNLIHLIVKRGMAQPCRCSDTRLSKWVSW